MLLSHDHWIFKYISRHLRAIHLLVIQLYFKTQQEVPQWIRQICIVVEGTVRHFGRKFHFDSIVAIVAANSYMIIGAYVPSRCYAGAL